MSSRCLGCGRVYSNPPTVDYEDGHGGRPLEMCSCGCDLFIAVKPVKEEATNAD